MPIVVPHKPNFVLILLDSTTVNMLLITVIKLTDFATKQSSIFLQKNMKCSHMLEDMKSMASS